MIGPRLKLARAREHLTVLNEEVPAFIQSNPPTVKARKTQEGAYIATVNFTSPPARFGILAADVFQTLRASLDYLAWELALLNTSDGFPYDQTEFPICKDWDSNAQRRFNEVTRSLAQDARDEIQALQPYHRGNSYKSHPLWVLHFFCNIAKHRSIPMTGYAMLDMKLTPEAHCKVIDGLTVELIFPNPKKDFKPDSASYTICFGVLREKQGITLLSYKIIDLYNFVTEVVFPKFVRFFP